MNRSLNNSSPDIFKQSLSTPSSPTHRDRERDRPQESCLEGCTTTLKLLIKLIHEHHEFSDRENDDRKMNRVTGMINILDEVRGRLQKSQSSYGKRRVAELRRCNTDLRPRRSNDLMIGDDRSRSKKDMGSSMAARKSLEIMCSSLGKEKEIMATELSKKVHELNEMEEHISDLKIQNDMLLARLQFCNNNDKEKRSCSGGGAEQGNAELLERNRLLSEQLLKALDGFRTLKRKLKEAQEDKATAKSAMKELGKEVSAGLERLQTLKHKLDAREKAPLDIDGEILALQDVFHSLDSTISTYFINRRSTGRK